MKTAYLSLGSNLGDRGAYLREAVRLLEAESIRVVRQSSVYETEPRDLKGQPWFLNMVVEVETSLFPVQLLHRLQKIESGMGRKRLVAKGPRTIDLDILLFGRFVLDTPRLTIPHKALRERRFVLEPLAELAPDLRDPVTHRSVRELLSAVTSQVVRRHL